MQGLKAKMQNIMHPGSTTGTTGTGGSGPIGDRAQIRYGRLQLIESALLPKDLQGTRFHPYLALYKNGHIWCKSRTIKPDVAGMTNIMINDVSDVHVSQGDVNDEVEIRLYDDNLIKDTCVATGKLPLRNLYGAPFLVPLHPASDRFRPLGSFGGGVTTGVGAGVILGQAEIQCIGADRLFMGAGTAGMSGMSGTTAGAPMGTGVGSGVGMGSGVGAAGMGAAGMGAAGINAGRTGTGGGMGGMGTGAPVAGGVGTGGGMSGMGVGGAPVSAAPVAVATTAPGGLQSGGLQSGGLQSGGLQSGGLQSGGLQSGGLQSGGLQSGGVGGAPSIVAASKASAGVGSVPVGGQPLQQQQQLGGSGIGSIPEAR